MPSYPSVNLEKPAPSPVVEYRAHREAWASDGPCALCGQPCASFADAVHADGSVTGWVRVCPKCAEGHKLAAKTPEPTTTPSAAPADAGPV